MSAVGKSMIMHNEEQLELDSWIVQLIKNKASKQVQLKAVKNDGYNLHFIKNPSEQIQLEAVKRDGCAICYIKNPSKEVQLEAVKENGFAIKYIKDPCISVKLYLL